MLEGIGSFIEGIGQAAPSIAQAYDTIKSGKAQRNLLAAQAEMLRGAASPVNIPSGGTISNNGDIMKYAIIGVLVISAILVIRRAA